VVKAGLNRRNPERPEKKLLCGLGGLRFKYGLIERRVLRAFVVKDLMSLGAGLDYS
jgi:hypothetical protein